MLLGHDPSEHASKRPVYHELYSVAYRHTPHTQVSKQDNRKVVILVGRSPNVRLGGYSINMKIGLHACMCNRYHEELSTL